MSRYLIHQKIHFCYGHRLLDYEGPCAHPHGHDATAEFTISSEVLDKRGMVLDFGDVKKRMKAWIDENIDHVMILRKDDPLRSVLEEMKEPVFVMEGNPTVENLAKVLFEEAERQKIPIQEVRIWETPNQSASYRT